MYNFFIGLCIFGLQIFVSAFLFTGCGATSFGAGHQADINIVAEDINTVRGNENLPPLIIDSFLNRTAGDRAAAAVSTDVGLSEETPLPRIIKSGCFARFALSHGATGANVKKAVENLIADPLGISKITHSGVTHMGIGIAKKRGERIVILDLARVMAPIKPGEAHAEIVSMAVRKRDLNNVPPLKVDENLDKAARDMAQRFMAREETSDRLIEKAQAAIESKKFALGMVTISFQVADDLNSVIIPERTSDPALAFIGIGVAQGNHPDHETGSIAVTLFLAEPQTAHAATRKITDLPPAKAVPLGKSHSRGTILEQAWLATLVGKHASAARLFEKAYRTSKKPILLYEAARAHARNDKLDKSLKLMRKYAKLVEGEDLASAKEKIQLLEAGKSIFSQSEAAVMSHEARRFFVMGQRLFEQGEWEGAIDAFQQAFAYAKHPDILYNIGLAHLKAGRLGTAMDFFAEYQRIVPEAQNVDQAKQLFGIGVELYNVGQFEAASKRFAMAYSFLPIPDLVYNLALCYKAMGQKAEAVKLLREFLDSGPSESEATDAREMIKEISP